MTREEILNTPEIVDFMIDKSVMVESKMKLHKRLDELCKLAIKALEQEDILDKIYEIITDALDKSTDQKESQTLRWVLDKISEVQYE